MKSFDTWNYEEVEIAFGIKPQRSSTLFESWLRGNAVESITDTERNQLSTLRELLFEEVKNWNEDELKLFFIGPLLSIVNLSSPYFKPFTQRTLSIERGNISASGKVDFMIAKGKSIPRIPLFCLHEYNSYPRRQENRRENDPLGQLLIGMVAAHERNDPKIPIYGCYVSGRNWFFILLEGDNYSLSNAYNAADNDIFQIFSILKKCWNDIEKIVKDAII